LNNFTPLRELLSFHYFIYSFSFLPLNIVGSYTDCAKEDDDDGERKKHETLRME
jgi:hypothetical protein